MTVHFILPGETFQSIADQINLENPLYIKEFHNQHCAKEDYIYEDLVARKKLLLPDVFTVQKFNAKNDAPFKDPDRNPKINFIPEGFNSQYKTLIRETSTDGDGKTLQTSFSYNFSLKLMRTEFDVYTFHFQKNNFSKINETKIGNLAIKCMQLIEPVEIHTNLKGEIIKINLLPETIQNFPEIKEKLLDLFPDKYAKIYIDEFEYVVLNQDLFHKKMKQDWLIKTYFAPIRKDFKNGQSDFRMFLENQDLEVNIQQNGFLNRENDEVVLTQISPVKSVQTDFTANYIIAAENGMIKSMDIRNSYSQNGVLYNTHLHISELS